ncbi:RlpA-like double-psi beta-barrel-protein domain-containing protein-containing protein [Gautieria morchelliformis]|nr:RlpA-like double-psi beta-barrel-protein domain-containing protein-containing protein [Gautieria morchelliformis]
MRRYLCILALLVLLSYADNEPWQYPPSGFATMTHYDLPRDYVASCGCTPASTHYPTAALSQLAFGSSVAYGPGCGQCFNLSLLNTFLSDPPFFPPVTKSIIIKVTDLCPGSTWCGATPNKPNQAGHFLNFDLAFPSAAIPSDFFPSNQSLYGYTDFGVWNISYAAVPCQKEWAGFSNAAALGSVTNLGNGVCCPADPFVSDEHFRMYHCVGFNSVSLQTQPNTTCPSYSLQNGIPPPNTSTTGLALRRTNIPYTLAAFVSSSYLALTAGDCSIW